MTQVKLRDSQEADFETIVVLNAAEVAQTSAMDIDRLRHLHGLSNYHKVAEVEGRIAGFLIAIRSGALYENDNFGWFAEKVANFMYVDRIVINSQFAGMGIGSALYEDLFLRSRALAIATITCEYNIVPPNPASRAFHDKFGFSELGTQWVADGTKQVSLQSAAI